MVAKKITVKERPCLSRKTYLFNQSFHKNTNCYHLSNLTFGGTRDSSNIDALGFQVSFCKFSPHCKNISEIKNFLTKKPLIFNINTIQLFPDVKQINNIVQAKQRSFYSYISPSLSKVKDIYFKQLNVTTDFGILMKNENTTSYISVDSEKNDYDILDNSKEFIVTANCVT